MQTMLPTPDLSVSLSPKQTKPYACTICTQRKVKCDKHYPCMSCTKSRLRCEYRSTPPPPRRKRKLDDSQRVSRPSVQGRTISSPGPAFGSFCAVVSPRAPSPRVYNNDRNNAASTSETTVIERQHEQALPSNRQPSISATSTAPSNPGILVAKEGGGRYYEQDSVGSIGQEVSINFIIICQSHIPFRNHTQVMCSTCDRMALSMKPLISSPRAFSLVFHQWMLYRSTIISRNPWSSSSGRLSSGMFTL